MLDPTTLPIAIGVFVIVLFGGMGLVMSKSFGDRAEERLTELTGDRRPRTAKKDDLLKGILARPAAIDLGVPSIWSKLIPNAENVNRLYQQADVQFSFKLFVGVMAGLAAAGAVCAFFAGAPIYAVPGAALVLGALPVFWLLRRRKKRISQFVESMPDAVDLIGRALRSGHGLASGLGLVAEEMKGPIAVEFTRVYEEQNLGIPIELALRNMADRIPVMDVRFFVIAVIVQRTTGGDLAEVLDKIGRLIRQRFELHGHVKALTAEGRISGLVLLALPPMLLAFQSFTNYDYVGILFNTPVGVKMLVGTAVMQLIGAWVIKKIVAIKV
jgi:tight adherence protein B